jgi:hypothetical protein
LRRRGGKGEGSGGSGVLPRRWIRAVPLDMPKLAAIKTSVPATGAPSRKMTSEKASPAVPMPEGADGSAYNRDGTCGTGGAGAVLRVSRRLPADSPVCRTEAGSCAGLRVPGSLHAGRLCERH